MTRGHLFIGGQWVEGTASPFVSRSPGTEVIVWEGAAASSADIDRSLTAARQAFGPWSRRPLSFRLDLLARYRKELETDKEEIAALIALETGKPLWESRTEVATMIGKIELSIRAYHDRTGEQETSLPGATARLRHRPHGVVAVFGPFNFPGHLPNGHMVPALLAGNSVVFKPSEQTPAVAEKMVQCWEKAGLPDGVLNLVQGQTQTGVALSNHPQLDGLFFTGSSATGSELHRQFSGHPEKILALEMGGNNPLIVTKTSRIKGAVCHTLQSAFLTAGQRCTCARRLILPKGPDTAAFLDTLVQAAERLLVGPQADGQEPFMGSLISNDAADSLLATQTHLQEEGGRPLLEMKRLVPGLPYLSPGIMDVTAIRDRPDREYFGPFLQVIHMDNFDAAMTEANATAYGLSAGIFTDDKALYDRFRTEIRAGIVNWNRPLTGASGAAPFGGIGKSGNHRPSAYYAADYCAYPVASLEADSPDLPETLPPGMIL
ncbi:succinylglutamate-semialdehyde dehydrogenase [Sneathiella chinensis]|uniref:N-succinylglutamate 5-semialdehyde dehydrogenase n=1 Tax=Sneathiella chinensis TaxID=349750 RepID=A0ABQ5U0U1_9PROT|nr:succinylglutamate-semialdehyde dehydrogenase [Sneathiella chinensis]GLQ05438.1 N-succinylglutamate 5-semialdehyde dehydrogenase [Sneathiella chinensis]